MGNERKNPAAGASGSSGSRGTSLEPSANSNRLDSKLPLSRKAKFASDSAAQRSSGFRLREFSFSDAELEEARDQEFVSAEDAEVESEPMFVREQLGQAADALGGATTIPPAPKGFSPSSAKWRERDAMEALAIAREEVSVEALEKSRALDDSWDTPVGSVIDMVELEASQLSLLRKSEPSWLTLAEHEMVTIPRDISMPMDPLEEESPPKRGNERASARPGKAPRKNHQSFFPPSVEDLEKALLEKALSENTQTALNPPKDDFAK